MLPFASLRPASLIVFFVLGLALCLTPRPAEAAASRVDLDVPDLPMTNQEGESGKLISEIIGDRLAAITFTYTTCTTICPVLDGIFQKVQGSLDADLRDEVTLITISIDPVTDIPPRLKEHAEKLGAEPGWIFLTGEKDEVNAILKGMEVYTPDIYNHPPTVFIVDGKTGIWSRLTGFPSPRLIRKTLDAYRNDRGV